MHAKTLALLLALFLPLLHANVVIPPTVYEQDDFGDPVLLQDFTYSLSVDCTAATISVIAMDEQNKPVEGAYTYLKYIDFSSPLISKGPTDREGFVLHKLPGSTKLMRGLFVLVMEKNGFRGKEVHFDISGCYSNGTVQPKPPAAKPPANNTTTAPPADVPPPFNYTPLPTGANNTTGNQSGAPGTGAENASGMCLPAFLIALSMAMVVIFKFLKRGKPRRWMKHGA
ncbi:MAG: hypothetical protein PHV13_03565 [Candidatus ainarchaeum sp.]|nr:hypothetical protein [Candidatus ainarchaeum sp.]